MNLFDHRHLVKCQACSTNYYAIIINQSWSVELWFFFLCKLIHFSYQKCQFSRLVSKLYQISGFPLILKFKYSAKALFLTKLSIKLVRFYSSFSFYIISDYHNVRYSIFPCNNIVHKYISWCSGLYGTSCGMLWFP